MLPLLYSRVFIIKIKRAGLLKPNLYWIMKNNAEDSRRKQSNLKLVFIFITILSPPPLLQINACVSKRVRALELRTQLIHKINAKNGSRQQLWKLLCKHCRVVKFLHTIVEEVTFLKRQINSQTFSRIFLLKIDLKLTINAHFSTWKTQQ